MATEFRRAAQCLLEPRAENTARIEKPNKVTGTKSGKTWRKAAVMGGCAAILVVVGYMSWASLSGCNTPSSLKIRLAVLPFQNLTGDPNKEYLADGLDRGERFHSWVGLTRNS